MTTAPQLSLSPNALSTLTGMERGIEKEGLRFTPQGHIAQSDHPRALGSTLTHPWITTDYSEALLEFITPKLHSIEHSLTWLDELHAFTQRHLGNEQIWPASMPCRLKGPSSIPIAQYGSSNIGIMKHVYRRGLEVRYGRTMQAIAGIHYNISLPDEFWSAYQNDLGRSGDVDAFRSDQYFHLIRNFHRHSWVLYYLFGASPVLDQSFFGDRTPNLDRYGDTTWGLPFATSLRMSDLGYTNSAQQDLHIGYDSIGDYIRTLSHAVHQPYPAYEALGVKDKAGEYQQLNANILQIENEYYSEIRPKRVAHTGERPVQALRRGGVEYIEVRAPDINPFLRAGIDRTVCRFIDAFALYCLLTHSAQQCPNDWAEIAENRKQVIKYGRQPGLELTYCDQTKTVQDWVKHLLTGIAQAAELLDQAYSTDAYSKAVTAQHIKASDPDQTPSGQVMSKIKEGTEFIDLIQSLSSNHTKSLQELSITDARLAEFEAATERSLAEQSQRELDDDMSFDQYLADYNKL